MPGPKPIPLQKVAYPLTGGVDTKVHGLTLPPPKLQRCINAYVDKTGSVQRRPGYTSVSNKDTTDANIDAGNTLAAGLHQGALLNFYPLKLYSYSELDDRWADRGRCAAPVISSTAVEALDGYGSQSGSKDLAKANGYTLYAYDYYRPSGTNIVTTTGFTFVDSGGTRLASAQTLATVTGVSSPSSSVKVIAHNGIFYIVYFDVSTASTMKCFKIDPTSAATLASSLAGAATTLTTTFAGVLDVVDNIFVGPCVTWIHTTASTLGLGFINTSGALVNNTTLATVAAPLSVSLATARNLQTHAVAYHVGTTPNDVYAKFLNWSGTAWTTLVSSTALDTALVNQVAAPAVKFESGSTTVVRVFYHDTISTQTCIRQALFTSAGTVTSRVQLLPRAFLVARPFTFSTTGGTETAMWVQCEPFGGQVQPTLFLMRNDGVLIAMASRGLATMSLLGLAFGHSHVAGDFGGGAILVDQYVRLTGQPTDTGALSNTGSGTASYMREIYADVETSRGYSMAEDGQCLYIGGGLLQQYDGKSVTEVGFTQFVDNQNKTTSSPSTTVGTHLTILKIYSYRGVWESVNAQGEREQGTDNGPYVAPALTGTDNTITLVADSNPFTNKTNAVLAWYRTENSPTSDSPWYRVGSVPNDKTATRLSFIDTMSDATLVTQEQFYEGTGEVDNVPPGGGGSLVCAGNGRVFVGGFVDDPNLVVYSKTRGHGEALAFSDALQILFPQSAGPLTALAVFNDSLLAFTETDIYRVNGDGLNNTGTAGGFTNPVRVQCDAGALSQRCVVVTPGGVVYRSRKGFMLLTPSFTVEYIGAPVEKLIEAGLYGDTVSSCLVPGYQQVRFSDGSAGTLVFDYYHAQWYESTVRARFSGVIWNDKYTIGGSYEDPAVFVDGSAAQHYAVTLVLGWMTEGTQLGDLSIRKIGVTGQVLGPTYLSVYLNKDQESTSFQSVETTQSTIGGLFKQWRVSKQLCSAMQVTIRDAIPDGFGVDQVLDNAGFCLNELTFEMGLRNQLMGRRG